MVLCAKEAETVFLMAKEKDLILMEGINTAYAPGFLRLLSLARSGKIGEIKDVEVCLTKLLPSKNRELDSRSSVIEFASYPLLAILKLLGKDYKEVYLKLLDQKGVDRYTKYILGTKCCYTAKLE